MNEVLYKKVRSAAVSLWWTILVAIGFTMLVGGSFMMLLHARPLWVTNLWGGLSWDAIQEVGLWMIAVYRLIIWLLLLAAVWLTIWSAKLRRAT